MGSHCQRRLQIIVDAVIRCLSRHTRLRLFYHRHEQVNNTRPLYSVVGSVRPK